MLRVMTILILAVIAGLLSGQPSLSQDSANETVLIQGDEKIPARILPGRVALVLSEDVAKDSQRYRDALAGLKGVPISMYSNQMVQIEASDEAGISSLLAFARDQRNSRRDMVIDSGLLVTLGRSEIPLILTERVIIEITEASKPELVFELAKDFDAEVVAANPFNKKQFVIRLKPSAQQNAIEVSNAINARAGVRFAQPDFYRPVETRQSPVTPNDQFFGRQWHLANTGQGLGTVDADIDADLAWSFGMGSASVTIAIIDSGFETGHPDLHGALYTNPGENPNPVAGQDPVPNQQDDDHNGLVDDIHGWDFTNCTMASSPPVTSTPPTFPSCGDPDVSPDSGYETHGTAVVGAAVALANNSNPATGTNDLGVVGVCPQCKFLPIRVYGAADPDYARGLAIDYAAAMGANIISNSWGYPTGVSVPQIVRNALLSAATNGRGGRGAVILFGTPDTVVDRCGGMDADISALPYVIAVSGSTNEDKFADTGIGNCVDVLAPTDYGTLKGVTTDRQGMAGINNAHTLPCNNGETSNRDYTFCMGGTSFSTPVTAGVAGLILSLDDSLTRAQVQQLLQDTADKISDSTGAYSEQTGFSSLFMGGPAKNEGYGRINAFEAVRLAASRNAGGRGGVDVYFRDNRLDWGNTEQPSNVTFEKTRGFIPHWQSVDIKVDAPPFLPSPPATSVEFDAFAHENPLSGTTNRVYVRVHNRGPRDATDVRVKLHWAFAGAGLPALPSDFWSAFPNDASDTTIWHPLPMQTTKLVPYSGTSVAGSADDHSSVFSFDFAAPIYDASLSNPDHYCLFAVVDAAEDPVSALAQGSLVPDFITPRDNNVTHRNVQLLDSGNSNGLSSRFIVANPFKFPIETRIVARLPKGWEMRASGIEMNKAIELPPGKTLPVEISITANDEKPASVDVLQLYRGRDVKEEVLGGLTFDVAPRRASLRPAGPSPRILDLISEYQKLVGDYKELLAGAVSKPNASSADRVLLDRMGKLLEDQGRLLTEVKGVQ